MTSAENPEGMASHPLTAALPAFHLSFSLFSAMPSPMMTTASWSDRSAKSPAKLG